MSPVRARLAAYGVSVLDHRPALFVYDREGPRDVPAYSVALGSEGVDVYALTPDTR